MKIRFLTLLLTFALLINFGGVHALLEELSLKKIDTKVTTDTSLMPSHSAFTKLSANNTLAHSGCAMHAHSKQSAADHACDKSAKKSHVCGSLKCDCGCHLSALTFAAIGIAGASHAAKLAMFQPQRAPLAPVKLSLRPPILA